jgi:hypothetical protein
MTQLEEFLNERDPRDMAPLVERLYRYLPSAIARLAEKRLAHRHMRSIASKISFQRKDDSGWMVRHGMQTIVQSRPLEHLVGPLDRPVTIVATGPSAKDYCWEELRHGGRFVIAVNGAPTILKKENVRPDLLVVSDNRFAQHGGEHFLNAPGVPLVTILRAASILATESPNQLLGRPFSLIERINSWHGLPRLPHNALLELNQRSDMPFHFPETPDPNYRIGWSSKPELGYFSGSTVVLVALQIAVGLGATDIEIIGMDLSGAGRAYDEGGKARPSSLVEQYEKTILPSFKIMHRAMENSGVRIRNLSPVCPLPCALFA